ncbi:hypothetical protein FPV67DRAFT_1665452 [Lyophyllum atratum]|nr:hypothetical protein FPV67DRAFT_1665452 [Lyophyllum atratum]
MSTATPASPTVKKMEKELAKEGKTEEAHVKHILHDLASTEKAQAKAEKAARKAESALNKAGKKELAAAKAANKATHNRDIAVTKKHSAEEDARLKQQRDTKLQKDIQDKKAMADAAVKDQELHNRARDAKLAEVTIGSAESGAGAGAGAGTGAGAGAGANGAPGEGSTT